jgi:site-specific recombinase XerD
MISNYSRCIASTALHFNRLPHFLTIEEINSFLYEIKVKDYFSASHFKMTIYALRYWFRLFGMEEKAIAMPQVRRSNKLPVVLSKRECRELFLAPDLLKHRYLLAFAYGSGLRMNELRMLKIADIDTDRNQIHVRAGKGRKDRYVVLATLLSRSLDKYLKNVNPLVFLFEGSIPGRPYSPGSIRSVISAALKKTSIKKKASMHTLRHSFATHLLDDGMDIHSIQRQLGHSDIHSTLIYLHISQLSTRRIHSPLDSLYNIRRE